MTYELTTELKKLADKQVELKDATVEFKSTSAELKDKMLELEQKLSARNDVSGHSIKGDYTTTMADNLLKSEQVKQVAKGTAPRAGIDINVPSLLTKSTITSTITDGTLPQGQRVGIVGATPQMGMRLRDVLPVAIATSGTIEWVKQTNGKQLAKPQFSAGEREGVTKQESSFTFALEKTDVVTLAHYGYASRQVLDDSAELQGFIAGEMMDGLERELENQIINGAGIDGDFDGFAKSGNSVPLTIYQTGDTPIDMIRNAIAQLANTSFIADGVILNPIDYSNIELQKDTTGDYVISQARTTNSKNLWGIPVYESEYMTQGEFYVCALRQSCKLWVRADGRLLVSESHADTFIKNILTLLIEGRFALTVQHPEGIISGAF